MIDDDDIVVRVIDLPHSVRGFTTPSSDGIYNIYLNARLSFEMRRDILQHELEHIRGDDFESGAPVGEIEAFRQ